MNCLECQELLQNRLDGTPTDPGVADALERHLHHCGACRQQHAAAARLVEGLQQQTMPKLPAGFALDTTHYVLRDRRHRQEKMRRRVLVTAALAAGILLTLFAAYWWVPRVPNQEPIPKTPFVKIDKPAHKPPEVKKQEPKNAFAALTERLADTTRDHAKVVLVATNVEKLGPVGEIPMFEPGVREASQEVTEGVRTVTHSARRAFDFFARELPMPGIGE